MVLLALLVSIPLGDFLEKLPRARQQVPQAYEESTRLPGGPPASAKDLHGAWQMDYSEDDVNIDDYNVELVVKLLDGCSFGFPSAWFFAAGLTNVEVDLRVIDTATGEWRQYLHSGGVAFPPIQDTAAFPCR